MASESETIADIVAEVRRNAESSQMGHKSFLAPIAAYWRRLAARLEAAWKRERESLLTKQGENVNSGSAVYTGENKGGNAAAMRKELLALSAWVKIVKDHPKDKTATECAEFVEQAATAALSAPPRNCDRPECATIDGMVSAHEEFCESWHEAGNSCAGCPHNKQSRRMTCREVWLMAPAEKGADE